MCVHTCQEKVNRLGTIARENTWSQLANLSVSCSHMHSDSLTARAYEAGVIQLMGRGEQKGEGEKGRGRGEQKGEAWVRERKRG